MHDMHRPLATAFVLSALFHLLTVIVVEWLRPPPAPRRIVVRPLPRRALEPARLHMATSAIPFFGMKRGQASPRDLPIEYSVEQVSCGRGLRADELSRHRVILTDYVGVESTADLASHLASGGFAMTGSRQMEEMERLFRHRRGHVRGYDRCTSAVPRAGDRRATGCHRRPQLSH